MAERGEGEKVIMQEDCGEDNLGSGYLTLTNQRLIFQRGKGRMLTLSKTMGDVALDLPLSKIKNVRTEGLLAKKVVVEVSDDIEGVYKFGVFSPGKWRDVLQDAKSH